MRFYCLILILFSALLTSCGKNRSDAPIDPEVSALEAYEKNIEIWEEESEGRSYKLTYKRLCYCVFNFAEIVVSVDENGEASQVEFFDAEGNIQNEPDAEEQHLKSINDFFSEIENAISEDYHRISVIYDKDLGYPTSIILNADGQIADDETIYDIRSLEFN